jgi:hypothetical protein
MFRDFDHEAGFEVTPEFEGFSQKYDVFRRPLREG